MWTAVGPPHRGKVRAASVCGGTKRRPRVCARAPSAHTPPPPLPSEVTVRTAPQRWVTGQRNPAPVHPPRGKLGIRPGGPVAGAGSPRGPLGRQPVPVCQRLGSLGRPGTRCALSGARPSAVRPPERVGGPSRQDRQALRPVLLRADVPRLACPATRMPSHSLRSARLSLCPRGLVADSVCKRTL